MFLSCVSGLPSQRVIHQLNAQNMDGLITAKIRLNVFHVQIYSMFIHQNTKNSIKVKTKGIKITKKFTISILDENISEEKLKLIENHNLNCPWRILSVPGKISGTYLLFKSKLCLF